MTSFVLFGSNLRNLSTLFRVWYVPIVLEYKFQLSEAILGSDKQMNSHISSPASHTLSLFDFYPPAFSQNALSGVFSLTCQLYTSHQY